jgi:hypothetical protein
LAIAVYSDKLTRTISTDGLGEHALAVLSILRDRLARGEGIREAALGTVGYSPPDVDAAIAKQDSQEMRAFEALLARSSGASGSCCVYSERPTRDDGQRRLVLPSRDS